MSSQEEQLLAKLKKQKEKQKTSTVKVTTKTVFQKVKKSMEPKEEKEEKKQEKKQEYVKTAKSVQKFSDEEDNMKILLKWLTDMEDDTNRFSSILESAMRIYISQIKVQQPDETKDEEYYETLWDELSDDEKRPYILQAIQEDKSTIPMRRKFIEEFSLFNIDLQNMFIDSYLENERKLPYITLFDRWKKENIGLIDDQENNNIQDKYSDRINSSFKYHNGEI